MTNKKAQEEMVGFVMIILLVAVIFLIFLGVYLRGNVSDRGVENAEVAQFLDSLVEVTSECFISGTPRSIGYLLERDLGLPCENGEEIGESLKETIRGAIESGWNFGPESPTKGYHFQVGLSGINSDETLIDLISTSCPLSKSVSATKSLDNLKITLAICKK